MGIREILWQISVKTLKLARLGWSGNELDAVFLACSSSSAKVILPFVMWCSQQIKSIWKREPLMPANSAQYKLCELGWPGGVFTLISCLMGQLPQRMKADVETPLKESLLTATTVPLRI